MRLTLRTNACCEGQPISILEAYASGCAVLASEQRGIRDVFRYDLNGHESAIGSTASIRSVLARIVAHSGGLLPGGAGEPTAGWRAIPQRDVPHRSGRNPRGPADRSSVRWAHRSEHHLTRVSDMKRVLLTGRMAKLPAVAAVPCVLVALVMMLSKTAMLSALVVLAGTFLVIARRILPMPDDYNPSGDGTGGVPERRLRLHAVPAQHRRRWGRSVDSQGDGGVLLLRRVVVCVQSFSVRVTYPLQMSIGMGPNFFANSGNPRISLMFKQSTITGGPKVRSTLGGFPISSRWECRFSG